MDVLLDGRKIRDFGIGVYIENLAKEITGKIAISFLCYEKDKALFGENCRVVNSKGYSITEQWEIWRAVKKAKPKLFHSPHYVFPILYKGTIVITIHDIIHLLFPQFFPKGANLYAKFMIGKATKRAAAVITVSERSKADIIKFFPEAEYKVHVIHNGINEIFSKDPSNEDLLWAEKFYPYILAVGNNKPHKRFPFLIKEFKKVRENFPQLNLVIAGWDRKVEDGIITLGNVSKEKLSALYRKAELLVHPSLYEGFGLPPFEASACGTPVLTSKVGAVEEILGEDMLYFEGEDLGEKIIFALNNVKKMKCLARNAKGKVKDLTWKSSAEKHLSLFRSFL